MGWAGLCSYCAEGVAAPPFGDLFGVYLVFIRGAAAAIGQPWSAIQTGRAPGVSHSLIHTWRHVRYRYKKKRSSSRDICSHLLIAPAPCCSVKPAPWVKCGVRHLSSSPPSQDRDVSQPSPSPSPQVPVICRGIAVTPLHTCTYIHTHTYAHTCIHVYAHAHALTYYTCRHHHPISTLHHNHHRPPLSK